MCVLSLPGIIARATIVRISPPTTPPAPLAHRTNHRRAPAAPHTESPSPSAEGARPVLHAANPPPPSRRRRAPRGTRGGVRGGGNPDAARCAQRRANDEL